MTISQVAPTVRTNSPNKTGTYYLFSNFKKGASAWKGGYDVDSYVDVVADTETNYIYVNNAKKLDVYKVTLVDTDKDGMPDVWEVENGLDPNNDSDALLDPDGDGRDNLNEYLNGSDPAVSNAPAAPTVKSPADVLG